jgi:hypothetical protein
MHPPVKFVAIVCPPFWFLFHFEWLFRVYCENVLTTKVTKDTKGSDNQISELRALLVLLRKYRAWVGMMW